MANHQEIELKLRYFDNTLWDEITKVRAVSDLAVLGTEKTEFLETIYYDTPAKSLEKAGLSYRIRFAGHECVATVKADGFTSGGLHNRSEWSFTINDPKPDITLFLTSPAGERLKAAVGAEKLEELFRTCFKRKSVDLRTPQGGLIELAVDLGKITAGSKEVPIQEIELELKQGKVAEVLQVAAELVRRFRLLPESQSKYYRGLLLINRLPANEERTTAADLGQRMEFKDETPPKKLLSALQKVMTAQEIAVKSDYDGTSLVGLIEKFRNLAVLLEHESDYNFEENIKPQVLELQEIAENFRGENLPNAADKNELINSISRGLYLAPIYEICAWLLMKM